MLLRAKSLFFRAQGLGSREQGIVLARESFSHNQKIPSFVKGDVMFYLTGGFSTTKNLWQNNSKIDCNEIKSISKSLVLIFFILIFQVISL
jgi:hypothetical protein